MPSYCIKKPALKEGIICIYATRLTLKMTIELLLLFWLQFAEVLIAQKHIEIEKAEDCLLKSHRDCSLLRYLLKSLVNSFDSICSTVQLYAPG